MAEYGIEEDDELAGIKEWWRDNGLALVLGAVAGIAAIAGWQGWQAWQENRANEAAVAYSEFQRALNSGNAEPDKVVEPAERLQSDYGSTPYAAQAGLAVAGYFVERGDIARATDSLQWVVDYADQPPLRHIARVRQARLLWAQDQSGAALEKLDHDYPSAFAPLYEELAGDIQAEAGDREAARNAYRNALKNLPPDTDPAPLKRKLDAVSSGASDNQSEVS